MSKSEDSSSDPFGGSFLLREHLFPTMTPEKFTDEQLAFARTANEFSEKEILPKVTEIENQGKTIIPNLLKQAGGVGLLMVDVPEAHGGLGANKTTSMLIAEQFGRVGSFAASLGAHTGIGTLPIIYFGTDAQKEAYLPSLASGEKLAAYALTEPTAGSDAIAVKTKAVLDGDHYILNGDKQFITNGGFADVFIIFAKIDGDQFTAFIVDRDMGVVSGKEEHKMGIRGSSTCPLTLNDVRVPKENLLGEIGRGHKIAFNTLNLGRIKLGVATLGSAKWALGLATNYARERKQFGKTIDSFGLVRDKLAEMAIRIFVGETIGYRTTGLVDEALESATTQKEAIDAIEEFAVEASIAKIFGSEALNFVVDEAVQIHGGYGFIEDYHVARLFRDSRINRIFEGTNEINRLIIPGTLLKRGMKGEIPLMQRSMEVRKRTAAGDIPAPPDGPLAQERHVSNLADWMSLYVASVAVEKFQLTVKDEQEILGEIADMIIQCYCMDSVTKRCHHILTEGPKELREMAGHFLTAFMPRAYGFVIHTGRHLLMDILDGDELEGHLSNLNHLRMDWPSKVLKAKRQIAEQVIKSGGYPINPY